MGVSVLASLLLDLSVENVLQGPCDSLRNGDFRATNAFYDQQTNLPVIISTRGKFQKLYILSINKMRPSTSGRLLYYLQICFVDPCLIFNYSLEVFMTQSITHKPLYESNIGLIAVLLTNIILKCSSMRALYNSQCSL